ncbi:putative GPI-anchored protein PB15E9.01c [Stegastes partitus]|uniref:Adhesion G-protein coupled receptor G2 n=1 Tax=Stegastes partitus TaxID=144197 RepID=A0A9Y4K957_9TELE|nr:PREDICTED: putative GPI-anchored protein PB15E9.01c [Stegastes partitus]
MPQLSQMTVCVDIRVVVPGAWVAFSYSSVHAPKPELGLEGDQDAIYAWLLRVRHRFPLRLSLFQWHRVCLRRDGVGNTFSLEVDGRLVATRTAIATAIPPYGSLWLGCRPRDQPPRANLGQVELYLFRMWADLRHHGLCEDGTVIGWNARYWGLTSPKARRTNPYLYCGAYFLVPIDVEAEEGNKTEQDVRSLRVEEVSCREKANISQTSCDVLLLLGRVVSACDLQRAGVSALQQAGDGMQARVTGEVERVGRRLCEDVEPSSGGFLRCTSTSSLDDVCRSNNLSELTCSLIELNSQRAARPNTNSCSSGASSLCDCTAFCNSTSQFYGVRINVTTDAVSINSLRSLLLNTAAANQCATPSECRDYSEILQRYQETHVECRGTPQRSYDCLVILEMSGPVNGCSLSQLVQRKIEETQFVTNESRLSRLMVCGPAGSSVRSLLASNLTWVTRDLLTSDVCQADPTLLRCEANETFAVFLTDSCSPEPSTANPNTTQPPTLTNNTSAAPTATQPPATTEQTTENATAHPNSTSAPATITINATTPSNNFLTIVSATTPSNNITTTNNATTPSNNITTTVNATTPSHNITTTINATARSHNITTTVNAITPSSNITTTDNAATPSNNITTTVNATTPSNNITTTVSAATPSNNITTTVNATTPSNNITTTDNAATPSNNIATTVNATTPSINITTTVNATAPSNNLTTVDATTPSNNFTTTVNATTHSNNITTTVSATTPSNTITTTVNATTPSNNITTTVNATAPSNNITTTNATTLSNNHTTAAPNNNTTVPATTQFNETTAASLNNQTTNHTTVSVSDATTADRNETNSTTAATTIQTTQEPGSNLTTTANASLVDTTNTAATTTPATTVQTEINGTTSLPTTALANATTATTMTGAETTSTTNSGTTTGEEQQEEDANELLDQTQDASQLNSSQVAQLVDNLEKLLDSPSVSRSVGQKALSAINNLLDGDSAALSSSSNRLIQAVDNLGLKLVVTGDSETLSTDSLVLAIRTVDGTNFPATSADIFNTNNVQLSALRSSRFKRSASPLGSVFLPSSLTSGLSPEQQQQASRVQFTFYTRSSFFQDESLDNQTLVSPILGSSVANLSISNLTENIEFTIRNVNPVNGNYVASCAFWDFTMNGGGGGWSSAGCFVVNATPEDTTCSCNHLTSFAILLDLSREGIIDRQHAQILTFITYIGCGISAIFLSVTLLTYLSFDKLLRDIPSKILVQLCFSLLFLNLVFLLDGWLALYPAIGLCISTAFFLHYFLLTSFTWAGLEALHMYLSIVRVFTPYVGNYMLKFSLMGWGIPLIVVIIVISVDKDNYGVVTYGRYTDGTSDDFCWLRNDIAFYVGVVAYFLLMFVLCSLVFIVVMVQLHRIKKQNPQNQSPNRGGVTDVRRISGLIILLGLTWGFALFAWGPLYLPFVYLFSIFNSLQGFFVFVFHCAVKENVRRQWRTYLCCGSLRLAENSEWSRTATANNRNLSVATATTSALNSTSRSSSVISDATNSSGSVFADSGISDGSNSDVVLNEIHRRNLLLQGES